MDSSSMNNFYTKLNSDKPKVIKPLLNDKINALNCTLNNFLSIDPESPGVCEKNVSDAEMMKKLMPDLKSALERIHQRRFSVPMRNMPEGSLKPARKNKGPEKEQFPLPPSVIRATNHPTKIIYPSLPGNPSPPPPPPRTCSRKDINFNQQSLSPTNFEGRFRFPDADNFPSPPTYKGTEKVYGKSGKSKGFSSFCTFCISNRGNSN